jgi:hypothetical protein
LGVGEAGALYDEERGFFVNDEGERFAGEEKEGFCDTRYCGCPRT